MSRAAASKQARLPGWREVVAGRYLIEEPIGAGGGGMVVAATHLFLGERVALKLVIDDHATDSRGADRLLREARITAKLRSTHVVRVLDAGIARPGVLFIAMEMLRGVDLRKRLALSGRLAVDVAIEHALGACDALSEAHALGVVHRDVKPSNLYLATRSPDARSEGGEVLKVLDFGVSKLSSPAARRADFTGSDAVIGSLCYMAPEQLSASACVDTRADVWSLAAVLFECLAGHPPYRARTLSEYGVVLGAARGPAPLRALRTDVPPSLDEALRQGLAIDRDDRTASIDDLARAIAAALPRRHPLRQRWLGDSPA
jgi:serine/threonine protein kinase